MSRNNFNHSNIGRPSGENEDNLQINNQIMEKGQKEELIKENRNYSFILKKYNIILKEYQEKYNYEIFDKLIKELESNEELKSDLNKRDLTSTVRLILEYEKKIKEQIILIKNLREEKERLDLDKQKIIEENNEFQNEIEKLKNDNDEIYKALEERTKQKQNKDKSKTFPIMNFSNVNDDIKKGQQIELEKTKSHFNDNLGNSSNNFAKTMNNFMNKENFNLKEKVDYEEMIIKLKKEIDNLKNQLYSLQNKLKKEMEETKRIEIDNNLKIKELNQLLIDNKSYKTQLNEYKESYEALENRKESEVENLIVELKDMMISNDNYIIKNKNLEEEIFSYKFENSKLKQENEGLKFDRDHLTKILEDSNIAVQNASEKEKYFDNMIKTYKKKNNEINLEKEKLNQKILMKENQLNKINVDFSNLLKEKINNYETLNNITKNKYEEIINNKENEIKELKATILAYKIERDKYLNDYNLFKNEYDKIEQKFYTENEIYIKKYEEAQNTLNNKHNDYISKINELKMDKINLEHEHKLMKDEIKELNQKEKISESKIKNLEKNNEDLMRENADLKKNNDIYLKQNSAFIKDNEKIKQRFKTQLEQVKENYDNKVIYLENIIEKQKSQLSLAETKALDIVKKQQEITEKYKTELKNTINHYENIYGVKNIDIS